MRTLRNLTLVSVLALTAVACSDSAATDTSSTAAAPDTTAAASVTTDAASVTTAVPEATDPPATAIDGPAQIDVVVGTDSGPERVEKVKAGADITLNITNPNAADEYHVHGIDLEQKADQGVMATLNFTIDEPGTYEVESHVTEDVLLVIEVV
jgi:hypothetical protein